LRESKERFRTLVEAITDYTYLVTVQDGRVVETAHGPGCLGLTGYSPEEFHANPNLWFQMVPPEDQPAVFDWAAKLAAGQKVAPLEHRIIHQNGGTRWVRNSAVPRHNNHGQYVGYEGLIQDFTAYNKLRDQFDQAQKMETIGQLAGGVAHDFRNQLTVIKGYGEMLLRRGLDNDKAQGYVEQILKAADRSATISGQLLVFSRQQVLRPEVISVSVVTGDMMKSLAQTLGEDIRLSVTPCSDLWNIRVDAGQFQQALLNLVLNARDAMPKGGQLTIQIGNLVLDEDAVRQYVDALAGQYVVLEVSDTGTGMSPEALHHLFEPFFTTKPVGQGTGLGLAMVHGFVAQSGGFMEVQSQPGQGTTFRLYFPAVQEVAESARPRSEAPDLLQGSGTVLVVEDEEAIRGLIAETLCECGYTVLEADNAPEALLLGDRYNGQLGLLITDVVMPDFSGPEVVKHFQTTRPGLPVLYVSGHTGRMLTDHDVLPNDANLLIKPFSPRALVAEVRRAMRKERRPGR
jgi:PAS domain S-box-containing protein